MEVDRAFSLISQAIDAGRNANGYLVTGDVRGNCSELVERILCKLFPSAENQVHAHTHPDVVYLEPEKKARIISVDSMRDRLVVPMSQTAFAGGWKVGVIVNADRLRKESGNAFLKSLEEPTPKTMYFLLTDQPDSLLPTIISRCQRISLTMSDGTLEGEARAKVDEVMCGKIGTSLAAKYAAGDALAQILAEIKDEAEDSEVVVMRQKFYRTILFHARQWMVEGRLPRYQAYRNINAIEQACAKSEQYLADEPVLVDLCDRLTFPSQVK